MTEEGRLQGRRVALGVSGGIAAYKAIECLRLLTEAGAEVHVIMTPESTRFVSPLTFEALSYHPVASDWLEARGAGEPHVELSSWAEVIAVVPATANTITKLATGLADEVLSGTVLASRAPLVVAPAMHGRMFSAQTNQDHLRTLQDRGTIVVMPGAGRLASGESGMGRLAAPSRIVAAIKAAVERRYNLLGTRVVISAGGTREAIDPVRYVGNFSSGKMGRALAEVASARGASVTLVTTIASELEGVREVAVTSAREMLAAVQDAVAEADILVMAAAVADYAPASVAATKIHRGNEPLRLELEPNVDILQHIPVRKGLFRVGFAAETEDPGARAGNKLKTKNLDMIVANQVGLPDQGLGSDFNAVTILTPKGEPVDVPRAPKWRVAERIWDAIGAARQPS
jgi:phosphopantothenoylcysteine decarboxylase/phosphopantothenate--cysteine ligase